MPQPRMTREQIIEAVRLVEMHGSVKKAAEAECIPRTTLNSRYALRHRLEDYQEPTPDEKLDVSHDGERGVIKSISAERDTPESVFEATKLDPIKWRLGHVRRSTWQVARRNADPIDLHSISIQIVRRVAEAEFNLIASLMERLDAKPRKFPKIRRPKIRDPHMLEWCPMDAHFGKLAWSPETGADYDLEIAERVFTDAVSHAVSQARAYPIAKCLVPCGSDFFHIDTPDGTTTKGTPQDVDGRWQKVMETGCRAFVNAVEDLAAIAPTEVVWLRGNHDEQNSWWLAKYVEAYFRNCPEVTVKLTPTPRQYVVYGDNLIGFAHGDKPKPPALPGVMASEASELFGGAKYREFHTGHTHQEAVITKDGVTVRTIPSLAATDAWHAGQGYVGGTRAAYSFIWREYPGFAAMIPSYVAA